MKFIDKIKKTFFEKEDEFEFLNIKFEKSMQKMKQYNIISTVWVMLTAIFALLSPDLKIFNTLEDFRYALLRWLLLLIIINVFFFQKYIDAFEKYVENYDKIVQKKIARMDKLLRKK